MGRKDENTGFICEHCGREVLALTRGTYRNHCPFCLHSKHVDEKPGDRASGCGGVMHPQSVRYHTQKGWQILHVCGKCGFARYNIVAEDASQPDDMALVRRIMAQAER